MMWSKSIAEVDAMVGMMMSRFLVRQMLTWRSKIFSEADDDVSINF